MTVASDQFASSIGGAAPDDVSLALEAGEIGVWEWDLPTGTMRWSRQMFRNLRIEPQNGDLYGVLLKALHPSERAAVDSAFGEFRTRAGPVRVEAQLAASGDEPCWIVFLGNTLAGPDGAPVRMLGITIDSTRRRKREEAAAAILRDTERRLREVNRKLQERAERRGRQLGASRAQMQAIFDNSPDWLTLFRVTTDGRVLYEDLNGATERGYGLDYDQIVGRELHEILGLEQAELPLSKMRACIATGENQRYTARRTLAGVTRTIDVMFVRVPEKHEGDDFIMSTARDITEREAMEEQLRQSQKMEAVGQLTGGLAHDFNNLLTAVIGNLELMGPRLGADPLARKYLTSARRSAENGAKLTEQLLAFSRRQHLQPRAIDLNTVVEGMRELLTRTIGATVGVRTALAPDLWAALVDPTQIEVAILNLALNARDAMPDGGTLTIETRNLPVRGDPAPAESGLGDCIRITVRDTGIGMTDEVARAAVEPFFTTKETGKGSGLGLSQVYGMVRQSNGALTIDSAPGAGTAVHLYLPRAGEAEEAAGQTQEPHSPEEPNARILVVDDDPEVRLVTVEMLRQLGYDVADASSGHAALDRLERGETCDLLLIDVAMPGLNGIATVERARRMRPGLRVLYATGYADLAESESGGAGSVGRIKKPFRLTDLAAQVRDSIGGQ